MNSLKKFDNLVRFSLSIPEDLLKEFEENYYAEHIKNRSDAFRKLMRDYVSRERWKNNSGEVFATITIVYDHHMSDLTDNLTAVQHDYGGVIVCSTHVHINHSTCLECIITKGLSSSIDKFIAALKKINGIKSLNFSVTSV